MKQQQNFLPAYEVGLLIEPLEEIIWNHQKLLESEFLFPSYKPHKLNSAKHDKSINYDRFDDIDYIFVSAAFNIII